MDQIPEESLRQFHEDEEMLLHIFPFEVWNLIFQKANSDATFALSNSSACFKDWLLPRRTAYLFPQVWIFLKPYYIKCERQVIFKNDIVNGNAGSRTPRRRHPIVRVLRRSYAYTLKLRLVCKDWCYGINALNFDLLSRIKMNSKKNSCEEDLHWMETKFDSTFNFGKFEQMILKNYSYTSSMFVCRSIYIVSWNEKLFKALEHIGSGVWYCNIVTTDQSGVSYSNIRETLRLLPNLKALEIKDCCGSFNGNPESALAQHVCVGELKNYRTMVNIW